MTSIRAIIIDDEIDGGEALKIIIGKYCPEISILGVIETPEAGISAIRTLKPDLVFLDVQMPHMSGFDLLQELSPINFEVIFVTAHDQYAIKAIRFSALDYLLKPVDVDDLIHAVKKVQVRISQQNSVHKYQSVLNNIQYKTKNVDRLAVPTFEGIDFFAANDIIFCQADGNYTLLYLVGKQKKLISKNLKDFENLLGSSGFCRVHHSYLINLNHVKKYVRGEGGYVMLTDDLHVDISRRKKDEFLNMLDKL